MHSTHTYPRNSMTRRCPQSVLRWSSGGLLVKSPFIHPPQKKLKEGSTGIRTQIGGFRVHSDNQLHYGAGHPEAMARIYKTRVASPRALVLSKCKCKCGWLALYYSANAWERACANAHGSRWPRPRPPEPSGSHREGGRDISFQNAMPTVGLEPTTTRLRVLRSAN